MSENKKIPVVDENEEEAAAEAQETEGLPESELDEIEVIEEPEEPEEAEERAADLVQGLSIDHLVETADLGERQVFIAGQYRKVTFGRRDYRIGG